MQFVHSDLLVFLIAPVVLFVILRLTRHSKLNTIFAPHILERLLIAPKTLPKVYRDLLLCVGVGCFIVALARPVILLDDQDISPKGFSVVVALDISKSMLSNDLYPSRLEFAKKKVMELIERNGNSQIALVSFADGAFMLAPLSLDGSAIGFLVKHIDTTWVSGGGTNILAALQASNSLLGQEPQKAVVLFTDGGDVQDFSEEIAFAKAKNIMVSVVNIGTTDGGSIPDGNGGLIKENGKIVIVKRNDAIEDLALQTDGVFGLDVYGTGDIDAITKHLDATLQKRLFEGSREPSYKEFFIYVLVAGFALVLMAFSSLPIWQPRRISGALVASLALAHVQPSYAGALDFWKVWQGQKAYEQGDYQKATKHYEALGSKGDYNLANSLYKQGQYNKALEAYERTDASSMDDLAKAQWLYNKASTKAKMGQLQQAKADYEASLELKQDDDAQFNLDLINKLLKQQEQNKQNDQSNSNSQDQNKQDPSKQDQSNQNQNKQDQSKQGQDKQNQNDQNQNKQGQSKQNDSSSTPDQKNTQDDPNTKNAGQQNPNTSQGDQKDKQVDYGDQDDQNQNAPKTGQQILKDTTPRDFISKQEEARWIKQLQKQKVQIAPSYKFNFKGKSDGKNW